MEFPVRDSQPELFDCCTGGRVPHTEYRGHAFAGEISIPGFDPTHPLFVKLERRAWFFDEAGWSEVSPIQISEPVRNSEDLLVANLAIR